MTSILKIVGVVMVVGVLCVGAVVLATDFIWDSFTADTNWITETNWDLDSSYPQNTNDNASITSGGNTCTLNDNSQMWVNRISLAGASPTKRKLHVKNGTLLANKLILGDYAELDVDQNVTVLERTELSKNVWIEIAEGKQLTAAAMGEDNAGVHIKSTSTILNLSGGGDFFAYGIEVAATADEGRVFKLEGGNLTIRIYRDIAIESYTGADDRRAKFWLRSGTINWSTGGYFEMVGGASIARRAELDLDETTCLFRSPIDYFPGYTMIDGYASIDLAAGKQFAMQRLTLGESGAATVVKLTAGSGAVMHVDTADDCP